MLNALIGIAVIAAFALCGIFAVLAERRASSRAVESERERTALLLAQSEARFKELAERIFEDRMGKFGTQGTEAISRIVEPFAKDIAAFRKRVDEINSEDAERAGELKERLEGLVRQTNAVTKEANNLASAIRADAQVTGQWGEIQLKKVLELGGLAEGVDYTYQETFAGEGSSRKNLRTDVLVKLPGSRWLVIDAKTTMSSYVEYNCTDDAPAKEVFAKRIIESVKNHVDELKKADYQRAIASEGVKVLPTVLMYIPFEEVYLLAMKAEVSTSSQKVLLREYARRNDVVFVNSTSLMPVVRLVAELWARDNADAKARKIVEAADAMIAKFKLFLAEFEATGAHISEAAKSYNTALSRLAEGKGNVMKRLADLKSMGVTSAGSLKNPEDLKEAQ